MNGLAALALWLHTFNAQATPPPPPPTPHFVLAAKPSHYVAPKGGVKAVHPAKTTRTRKGK